MVGVPLRCDVSDEQFEAGFDRIRDELQIPRSFPDPVLEEAVEQVRRGPVTPPGFVGSVRDASDVELISVDPPGSKDLDQAFSATRRPGGYRVLYAIADVSAFVAPGGAVDAEARARGATLYSPDRRTSLHPEMISENAASLIAGATRRALLWTIDLDADGEIVSAHLVRADVRNREQLSYRDVHNRVNGVHGEHPIALLREIGELRVVLEAARGAVSLQLPSQEVRRSAEGGFSLGYDEPLPAERWNAQISLLTGICASRMMVDAGVGLLRTLPPPDQSTVPRLRRTARALGIDWADSESYADRVRRLAPDSPRSVALLSQIARALRSAGYTAFRDHDVPDRVGHYAIASTYAHVTAPLRRLCDRFANEILVAVCADREPPDWATAALDELPSIMARANQKDRSLERAMVDFVETVLLEDQVGRRFTGSVTDLDEGRARLQFREPAIVTHIASNGLGLGDVVEVELVSTDPTTRRLEFARV